MNVNISKKTINTCILASIYILMSQFMYFLNVSDSVYLLIIIIFGTISYVKYFRIKTQNTFSLVALLPLILVVVAAFNRNGQSLFWGIEAQKNFFLIFLFYFPLRKLLMKNRINIDLLKNFICIYGVIECIVFFTQHWLYPKVVFLECVINSRNGARLYIDSVIIQLMILISVDNILKKNGKNFRNIILIILGVAYEFIVAQGRLECMALVLTLFIAYFLKNKKTDKKFFIIMLGAIIIIWALNSGIINSYIEMDNTMGIREFARQSYVMELGKNVKSVLTGCGYPMNGVTTGKYLDYTAKMYLHDNGIFAFVYVYGLMGAIFIILFYLKYFRLAFKLLKEQRDYFPFLFFVLNLVLSYNIIFWWWKSEWIITFVCVICYMENKLFDEKV